MKISDVLYEEVIEVHERVVLTRDDCQLTEEIRGKGEQKTTTTGDKVTLMNDRWLVVKIEFVQIEVWKSVDEKRLREDLSRIQSKGISSIAVALLHSYW